MGFLLLKSIPITVLSCVPEWTKAAAWGVGKELGSKYINWYILCGLKLIFKNAKVNTSMPPRISKIEAFAIDSSVIYILYYIQN